MKVIAAVDSDRVLLEATKDEVALMMGFRSRHDLSSSITVGTEMNLKKMAVTSEFIRTIDTQKLLRFREQIATTLAELDKATDEIQALTLFARLRDESDN